MLDKILPSYLYLQYQDDDNLQAFVDVYNSQAQAYLDWFYTINLPIYTSTTISGSLLDWAAQGLYGIPRPVLATGVNQNLGPYNTWELNQIQIDGSEIINTGQYYLTNDDLFKRCLTWNLYKGDGKVMNVRWLKRRFMRFLTGANGVDPGIDSTIPISIAFGANRAVTVTITRNDNMSYSAQMISAIQQGVLVLPWEYNFQFVII